MTPGNWSGSYSAPSRWRAIDWRSSLSAREREATTFSIRILAIVRARFPRLKGFYKGRSADSGPFRGNPCPETSAEPSGRDHVGGEPPWGTRPRAFTAGPALVAALSERAGEQAGGRLLWPDPPGPGPPPPPRHSR